MVTAITVVHNEVSHSLPLEPDFPEACASAFGLYPGEIAALQSGQVVYPLSFIHKFANNGMFNNRPLNIVLKRGTKAAEPRVRKQAGNRLPAVVRFLAGGTTEYSAQDQEVDIEHILSVREVSRLSLLSPQKLVATFSEYTGNDGRLDKEGFDACVRQLVPGEILSKEEKEFLSYSFSNLFNSFSRDDNRTVDLIELATGMSILTYGSTMDKLQFTFGLCDTDDDGFLNEDDLQNYLRSFLLAILSLNPAIAHFSVDKINELIDDTVEDMSDRALASVEMEEEGHICYDDFYFWYINGGDVLMPWLSSVLNVPAGEVVDDDASTEEGELLGFTLNGGANISIFAADVQCLRDIVVNTRLNTVDAQQVVKTFVEMSVSGCLTKSLFESCVRELVPGTGLDDAEMNYLSYVFGRVFAAYDRHSQLEAQVDELTSGFLLFSSGSKSVKLSLSFSLFDHDNDGLLDKAQLIRYVRSFLIMLFTLKSNGLALLEQLVRRLDMTAVNVAKMIITSVNSESVSFKQFGNWYNNGGDMHLPWIELYDLDKWPLEDVDGVETRNGALQAPTSFLAKITEEQDVIEISSEDMMHFEKILELSKLYLVEPDEIHRIILQASPSGNGAEISKENFDDCIRRLLPMEQLNDMEIKFLFTSFSNIFYAYDRNGTHSAPAAEIASGLSVLCKGSKSLKLDLAFDLFERDANGELPAREVVRFLRSFLTLIFAINEHATIESKASIWEVLDRACTQAVETMLIHANNVNGVVDRNGTAESRSGNISFENFALWYQNGGFERIPWLELLDIRKWPYHSEDNSNNDGGDRSVGSSQASDEAILHFVLDGEENAISITQQDVASLFNVLHNTTLSSIEAEDVKQTFFSDHEELEMTYQQFEQRVILACLKQSESDSQTHFTMQYLKRFFDIHDPNGCLSASVRSLCNTMALFAHGSKSAKLQLAFQSFAEKLDRSRMYLFIYGFLVTLLALSEETFQRSALEVAEVAHEVSVELTGKIFLQSQREDKDAISFDEFADWYTDMGYQTIPWLELLDLEKWPVEDPGFAQPEAEDEREVVFKFRLTPQGDSLELKWTDVSSLARLLDITNLYTWDYRRLHALLLQHSDEGRVSPEAFDNVVLGLTPDELSEEEQAFTSERLKSIFQSFSSGTEAGATLAELSSALSLFTSGSKSDKLELCFLLFAPSEDVPPETITLDKDQLQLFLASFLTTLFTLVSGDGGVPEELVKRATSAFADKVLEDAGAGDFIAFSEFADWYTQAGFEVVPWIELLNLDKWPFSSSKSQQL